MPSGAESRGFDPAPVALVACALVFCALAVFAYSVRLGETTDARALGALAAAVGGRSERLAEAVVALGDPLPVALAAGSFASLAVARGSRRDALLVLALVGGAAVLGQVAKTILAHPRPEANAYGVFVQPRALPSGHATGAMALALAATLAVPDRLRTAVAGLGGGFALAVGLATVVLGWHFPSDVAAGFLFAGTWALALVWAVSGRRLPSARAGMALPVLLGRVRQTLAVAVAAALALGAGGLAVARPDPLAVARFAFDHPSVLAWLALVVVCASAVPAATVAALAAGRPRTRRVLPIAAALALALLAGGCGSERATGGGRVEVFALGGREVAPPRTVRAPATVSATRPAPAEGSTIRFVPYVNGLRVADPRRFRIAAGDRVQWLRVPAGTAPPPAVVAAYPQPLAQGFEGERLPVRLECAVPSSKACGLARERLADAGIPVSRSLPGTSAASASVRVVVGAWRDIARLRTVALLGARQTPLGAFFAAPDKLVLLAADGAVRMRLARGAGLVAAVVDTSRAKEPGEGFAYVVTGTDERGTERAAALLGSPRLTRAVAVAVTASGALRLPRP